MTDCTRSRSQDQWPQFAPCIRSSIALQSNHTCIMVMKIGSRSATHLRRWQMSVLPFRITTVSLQWVCLNEEASVSWEGIGNKTQYIQCTPSIAHTKKKLRFLSPKWRCQDFKLGSSLCKTHAFSVNYGPITQFSRASAMCHFLFLLSSSVCWRHHRTKSSGFTFANILSGIVHSCHSVCRSGDSILKHAITLPFVFYFL